MEEFQYGIYRPCIRCRPGDADCRSDFLVIPRGWGGTSPNNRDFGRDRWGRGMSRLPYPAQVLRPGTRLLLRCSMCQVHLWEGSRRGLWLPTSTLTPPLFLISSPVLSPPFLHPVGSPPPPSPSLPGAEWCDTLHPRSGHGQG